MRELPPQDPGPVPAESKVTDAPAVRKQRRDYFAALTLLVSIALLLHTWSDTIAQLKALDEAALQGLRNVDVVSIWSIVGTMWRHDCGTPVWPAVHQPIGPFSPYCTLSASTLGAALKSLLFLPITLLSFSIALVTELLAKGTATAVVGSLIVGLAFFAALQEYNDKNFWGSLFVFVVVLLLSPVVASILTLAFALGLFFVLIACQMLLLVVAFPLAVAVMEKGHFAVSLFESMKKTGLLARVLPWLKVTPPG